MQQSFYNSESIPELNCLLPTTLSTRQQKLLHETRIHFYQKFISTKTILIFLTSGSLQGKTKFLSIHAERKQQT